MTLIDLLEVIVLMSIAFWSGWQGGRNHQVNRDIKLVNKTLKSVNEAFDTNETD